tara:strand:+ start:125 stop:301 length:177 start_codon:yes stop_codon:yes gene_type:complete
MFFVWGLALLISFGLRFWGFQHPQEFAIRPMLIWTLLFAPSLVLGVWLSFGNKTNREH